MKTVKKRIHFMGIGGSGMSGVAMLASKLGFSVTGCDLEGSTAYSRSVSKGHSESHLEGIDLLVISPAVLYQNSNHPEYLKAKEKGIVITWQEFLGKYLLKNKKTIAITGTHGKSTTTAMVGKLLTDAGYDPSVLVGAKVKNWKGNARFGKGEYFVVEADEFFDNFLHYNPNIIILNNIEFDHPDYFKNEDQVFSSYEKFVKKLKNEKVLIANVADSGVKKLLQKIDLSKLGIKLVEYDPEIQKRPYNLKVFGKHNQANALAVQTLGDYLQIDSKITKKSLEGFLGIERRMQLLGKSKTGFLVYDDYAHHPTAVKTTLQGLKEEYKNKKIWVVLEAHGFERTFKLLNDYNRVFDSADGVIIGPIFAARDRQTHKITPSSIAKASNHKNVYATDSFEKISDIVRNKVKKGDVLIVMGAGKSYLWAKKLKKI